MSHVCSLKEAGPAMAYSRGPKTALKSSASLLPGNLAVVIGVEGNRSLTYAVTHKNCVNLVHTASGVCTQEQVAFDTSEEDKDPASHLIQVSPLLCYLRSSLYFQWLLSWLLHK